MSSFFPRPKPRKPRPVVFEEDGPTGSLTWMLGLFPLLLPILGSVLAGPVMAVHATREARYNSFARDNALRAANWGLTYSLISLMLIIVHFGAWGYLAARGMPPTGFAPLGYLVVLWVLLSAMHAGVCIVGGLRARRGEEFRWRLALSIFS